MSSRESHHLFRIEGEELRGCSQRKQFPMLEGAVFAQDGCDALKNW